MKEKFLKIALIGLCVFTPSLVSARQLINTHTTLNYTKEEVIEAYNNSLPTFDYDTSYYKVEPNFNAPFFEGELKDGIVDDVLKQFNYYRYLNGLNSVTINYDKMSRSQKGAMILSLNNVLTHYPTKVDGMSEEFYNLASAGTGASAATGDSYTGNVSKGRIVHGIINGYVDDSSNVVTNSVGHRSSMLDPYATQMSFGYILSNPNNSSASRYSAVSVYYDNVKKNSDMFYAWPPAGYIPAESFPAKQNTMWSIWIDKGYYFTDDTSVTITYEGKDYVVPKSNLHLDYRPNGYVAAYYVPEELNSLIRRSNDQYMTDKPIKYKVTNIAKSGEEPIDIEYTTTFIQANPIVLNDITLNIITSREGNRYWYSPLTASPENIDWNTCESWGTCKAWNIGETHEYFTSTEPSDATISNIKVEALDKSILEVNAKNKTVKTLKAGHTKLIVTESSTGMVREYAILVKGVSIDKTELEMDKGTTQKLNAELVPSTAGTFSWSSSNPSVATVDENGNVKAVSKGTAVITVTVNDQKAECTVTVTDTGKGDLDGNGEISIKDAIEALYYVVGKYGEPSTEILAVGDMNEDGKITIGDAIAILKLYIG